MVEKTVSLLKSPFLLRQLMLRPTMGTLPPLVACVPWSSCRLSCPSGTARSRTSRFTDDQRRRLAVKATILGRRVLRDIATIVTPDTLLASAAGFFTVDVWTGSGLTRFAVLFLIHLSTRRVEIAGIAVEPHAAWMSQVGRNVTDASGNQSMSSGRADATVVRKPSVTRSISDFIRR
jgi:hypothetical protein